MMLLDFVAVPPVPLTSSLPYRCLRPCTYDWDFGWYYSGCRRQKSRSNSVAPVDVSVNVQSAAPRQSSGRR